MSSFSSFKLLSTLQSTLAEKDFKTPTEIQSKALPLLLEGKSVVGLAETGSGKTFMVTNFVHGLNSLPNWDYDKAFIWITFSDDLAMQSKDKLLLG